MRIDHFTTPYSDQLCDELGIEFIAEILSLARNKHDVCIDVPGYRQTKSYTCGFVSGLMVCRYFYPKTSHKKFYELCQMHPEWGMSTRKVATALRNSNIGVKIRQGLKFDQIADYIEQGHPMMTAIRRHGDVQHWVVIYGVNRKKKELFIAGEKFWFSHAETIYKWDEIKKQIPRGQDFLICWKKS